MYCGFYISTYIFFSTNNHTIANGKQKNKRSEGFNYYILHSLYNVILNAIRLLVFVV